MIAHCTTPECPQKGVEKVIPEGFALHPGETVDCGECSKPCKVTEK